MVLESEQIPPGIVYEGNYRVLFTWHFIQVYLFDYFDPFDDNSRVTKCGDKHCLPQVEGNCLKFTNHSTFVVRQSMTIIVIYM